ncbi:hypothetical protein VCR31J2_990002 [Vibrio coralliirubri]|uniref:Uncharacterized protein n=1 Tax=Vibrio coralliirubri TaxID=1516159 RepID=A0AA87C2A9_9VIBR|nr:hypothetical protein VCR31J2_990002 [Vibrio coralliirubri]
MVLAMKKLEHWYQMTDGFHLIIMTSETDLGISQQVNQMTLLLLYLI